MTLVMPLQSREMPSQSREIRLQSREIRPRPPSDPDLELSTPALNRGLVGKSGTGSRPHQTVIRSSRNPRITNSGRRRGASARRSPGSFSANALSAAAISTRARGAPTQ